VTKHYLFVFVTMKELLHSCAISIPCHWFFFTRVCYHSYFLSLLFFLKMVNTCAFCCHFFSWWNKASLSF